MILRSCPFEKEVAQLLAQGGWPAACAPELRAHVTSCRSCGDLVLVQQAFQRARAHSTAAVPLVSPGVLWWRAQLRRRQAAVERVGRPILGAQIFALAVNLLLVVTFLAYQVRHGLSWLSWIEQLPQSFTLHLEALWPSALADSGMSLLVLIPALATLALLSGVVVYLAADRQ
ncbi:MAG: hypothetical protein P4K94_05710 [Terracidiphilus sp.]|jgi:hypothetical protein|nr:hypothetical protein [Terracidiphilus sp.]